MSEIFSKDTIKNMMEANLSWTELREMMTTTPKDGDRLDKFIEILQERVKWVEKILLPVGLHLFIVEKEDGERVTKCECGYEFGDYRVNWKLNALIYARDGEEKLEEIYPGSWKPGPENWEIREFYCPRCATQLEVEAVPHGYPLIFDFLPDLDVLYEQWLGKPLKRPKQLEDRTCQFIRDNFV